MDKNQNKISSIIFAILIISVGAGGLLIGFGGRFSVLSMAVCGFIALYILGDLKDRFAFKISIKTIILGLLASFGVLLLSISTGLLLGINGHENPISSKSMSIITLFLTILVPSLIGEEAFTATWLSIGERISGGKVYFGIFLSTVLFVALHAPEYHGNFLSLVSVCGARLVFTWVALRKNSSFVNSSIVHIIYDTILIVPTMLLS